MSIYSDTYTYSSTSETYRKAFPNRADSPYNYVSYGLSFSIACVKHVSETFHAQRAYIVASTSLSKQTTHVRDLEKALGSSWAGTRVGIRPHSQWDDIVPVINDMREKKADCLITLGGSTLADAAKLIIYALANSVQTMEDLDVLYTPSEGDVKAKNAMRNRDSGNDPTVPIISIPTTLSGSEYTRFSSTTSPITHYKATFHHPKLWPSLVILDPTLTTTTPEWVWLSSGCRVIDHCVEAMCSLRSVDAVDIEAEKALRLLIPSLLQTKRDPSNLDARFRCQLATNYITLFLLYAPANMLATGSHGIGHQLGPLGVGHGHTTCILLPAVLKYNAKVNAHKQEKLKQILWTDPAVAEVLTGSIVGLREDESDAGDALRALFNELGMPSSLKDVGVGREKLDSLAAKSVLDACCVANPIPLTRKEQVLEILEMVVE